MIFLVNLIGLQGIFPPPEPDCTQRHQRGRGTHRHQHVRLQCKSCFTTSICVIRLHKQLGTETDVKLFVSKFLYALFRLEWIFHTYLGLSLCFFPMMFQFFADVNPNTLGAKIKALKVIYLSGQELAPELCTVYHIVLA